LTPRGRTTLATDLAIGVAGIAAAVRDRRLGAAELARATLARIRDQDDQLRADLIQHLMCQGEVPVSMLERRYAIEFRDYFRDALVRLQPMIDDGLVRLEGGRILATSRGRLLLRNIAMCFDRYLDRPGIPVKFSRAI